MSYGYSAYAAGAVTTGLGTFCGWTRTMTNAAASG